MQEHSFADGRRGGERVVHLVTLGTSHLGTPLADAAFALGLHYSEDFRDVYSGFIANMTWTNQDLLNAGSQVCNEWLSKLNAYAPAGGRALGRCGSVAGHPLKGYYEKTVAYGTGSLQKRDAQVGVGVFKPGSSTSLLVPYAWLREALSRDYANDGLVPLESALFDGAPVERREAYDCDHRYLERGYPVVVRTWTATTSEWAFCATARGTVATDIASLAVTASQVERVFAWAELAYAPFIAPAGAATDYRDGAYVREYAGTSSLAMIREGSIYYRGPSTGQQLIYIDSLAQLLARAQASGY
jgi:hypothetical protein